MASVIHLASGEIPPEKETCLIVTRDAAGGFFVLGPEDVYQRAASDADYPISDADRAAAIERAKAHADRLNVHAVYVVAD